MEKKEYREGVNVYRPANFCKKCGYMMFTDEEHICHKKNFFKLDQVRHIKPEGYFK